MRRPYYKNRRWMYCIGGVIDEFTEKTHLEKPQTQ